MKVLVLITSVLLIVTATAEWSQEKNDNPPHRQLRNQRGNSNGTGPNRRPPPPPAYYVETSSESGRRVYQINRADEKIHEQLGVLGVIAQDDNRRRNSPSDTTTNQKQNQNQNGRTQNQGGRNPTNRLSQNNKW